MSVIELSQRLLSAGFFDVDVICLLVDGAYLNLPIQLVESVHLVEIVDNIDRLLSYLRPIFDYTQGRGSKHYELCLRIQILLFFNLSADGIETLTRGDSHHESITVL